MTDPQLAHHTVVDRNEQPFVGITRTYTMATLAQAAQEIPGLLSWLGRHGEAPAGAPFLRYLVIDMAGDMVVQTGVPVTALPERTDGVEAGVLPAGRYVATTHRGSYDGLYGATRGLLTWAGEHELHLDKHPSERGEVWASRLEWYETDPAEQPDPTSWITRLTFKVAD